MSKTWPRPCAVCKGFAIHLPDCPRHPKHARPDTLPVAEVRQVLETIARWTQDALAERDYWQERCRNAEAALDRALRQGDPLR